MPPTVPINHYFRPAACAQQSCTHTGQQKTGPKVLFCCSMLIYSSKKCACFEHSNFFKVKPQIPRPQEGGKCMLRRQMNASKQTHKSIREKEMHPWQSAEETQRTMPRITPSLTPRKKITASRNPTTSFLTATTLVYAIGAGITAAAGTRLALQLVLDKFIKLFSFQLHHCKKAVHWYLLSLPPCVRIG